MSSSSPYAKRTNSLASVAAPALPPLAEDPDLFREARRWTRAQKKKEPEVLVPPPLLHVVFGGPSEWARGETPYLGHAYSQADAVKIANRHSTLCWVHIYCVGTREVWDLTYPFGPPDNRFSAETSRASDDYLQRLYTNDIPDEVRKAIGFTPPR